MYCLHSGGAAETWYAGLAETTKADWTLVEAAFNTRWPLVTIAAMTTEEYEESLLGCKMMEETLGTKENVADREVWSHIAWADKIGTLAAGADILGSKTYIGQVRKALPSIIRDKLSDSYTTWTTFLDDVRGIDIDYIRGKTEDAKKQLARIDAYARQIHHQDRHTTFTPAPLGRRFTDTTNNGGNTRNGQYGGARPPATTNTRGANCVVSPAEHMAF
ncbi:hypothetical protein C0991_003764 [Blastosporella zonata]|nr:hypothetical protein C0991_003764 [Blastosporella zonata]